MIRNIKSRKSMAFSALRILWKLALVFLQLIATIASDDRSKPCHSALKAQALFDEGLISIDEYNKCVHGDGG
ncbi:hypothetical protein Lgee_0183 [Legionella geestiana]|uniref:Uncharacterized protein n=1 Tax=Legionella geestiana TaxID=45065 RepID=A0A0W0U8X8_9GAMM|nr:hypothetical protein [Legionella geestiana]KTD04430.1 hypothetical protein Lgee_0183 [Legionella geestiana]QBS12923.1 hypothetical protein E4T54_09305 [Legionella geestiana]QDQ39397.1 hypothetical protein E3226_002765 [Legionella geestiana]STX54582.1 Uncharacterised protein [Legionella geestiana]